MTLLSSYDSVVVIIASGVFNVYIVSVHLSFGINLFVINCDLRFNCVFTASRHSLFQLGILAFISTFYQTLYCLLNVT